jgi:hypothetical protein
MAIWIYLFLRSFIVVSRGVFICSIAPWSVLFRVTILAEWLCHFSDLAVGETAAPANSRGRTRKGQECHRG